MNKTSVHPPDGTKVRCKAGMPGVPAGQLGTVQRQNAEGVQSINDQLIWIQTPVEWSHGHADGFWATRNEYELVGQ